MIFEPAFDSLLLDTVLNIDKLCNNFMPWNHYQKKTKAADAILKKGEAIRR